MTDHDHKPVLDEQTFEKLLEAAYVLQEHNRERQELESMLESHSEQLRAQEAASPAPPEAPLAEAGKGSAGNSDYTLTLAEIVETQRQIQMRHLDLDKAMALVTERTANITNASGAAIAILEGKKVKYRAGTGPPALPTGSEVALQGAICAASIRTGQVVRSEDIDAEFLFDAEEGRKRGIQSLLAVPIYYDGSIAGALELYFAKTRGFAEQDIHTCQLMAGLVTEALAREADLALKKSVAAERATMRETLEKLRPSVAAAASASAQPATPGKLASAVAASAKDLPGCRKCGSKLSAAEQFCGKCGTPRFVEEEATSLLNALPLNGSSLRRRSDGTGDTLAHDARWDANQAGDGLAPPTDLGENADLNASVFAVTREDTLVAHDAAERGLQEALSGESATALLVPQADELTWSSASKARDFLEALSAPGKIGGLRRFWNARRGDVYLAVAVILVAGVIRWGVWSNYSGGTGGTTGSGSLSGRKPAPDEDLSAFDKLLIALGLAEAPPAAPEYKGNPETQVWVDLHTALYYCPGADLYGKTPKGKYTNQRDAQMDRFEPAYRKVCD